MASRGKTLSFSDAEIERLADSQYNDKNTVLILSVLYPFVDLRNKSHVDHIFPATLLSRAALTKANVTDEGNVWIQFRKDKLANLQLMDGAENNEKRSKLPGAWIDLCYPTEQARQNYRNLNDIGDNPLLDISAFELLFNERRRKLVRRLSDELR